MLQCLPLGCYPDGDTSGNGQLMLILYHGTLCKDSLSCEELQNCTTLFGNLIIRSSIEDQKTDDLSRSINAYFPKLREVTGFVAVTLVRFEVFDILPNLSVIRGQNLMANYGLVVYTNDGLQSIYFKSLNTILRGGVRLERNHKLCYADSVRWKSIIKDTFQKEKYGIVINDNNPSCGKGCLKDRCHVVSGHGNDPSAQFCWGPGVSTDDQCQKCKYCLIVYGFGIRFLLAFSIGFANSCCDRVLLLTVINSCL